MEDIKQALEGIDSAIQDIHYHEQKISLADEDYNMFAEIGIQLRELNATLEQLIKTKS
jgi:hypothetical protein